MTREKRMDVSSEITSRDGLIDDYQAYVRNVVGRLVKTMGLPSDQYEEFIAAGNLGLVEAAERFDPNSGTEFKRYAFLRIRGAVIDSIRGAGDFSGDVYRFSKALKASGDIREMSLSTVEEEISDLNGAERLAKILDYVAKGALVFRLSYSDVEEEVNNVEAKEGSPERILQTHEHLTQLSQLLASLPEKERVVIEEHYFNDRTFDEIAERYEGLSKSWVSRLHARAVDILKANFLELLRNNNESLREHGITAVKPEDLKCARQVRKKARSKITKREVKKGS